MVSQGPQPGPSARSRSVHQTDRAHQPATHLIYIVRPRLTYPSIPSIMAHILNHFPSFHLHPVKNVWPKDPEVVATQNTNPATLCTQPHPNCIVPSPCAYSTKLLHTQTHLHAKFQPNRSEPAILVPACRRIGMRASISNVTFTAVSRHSDVLGLRKSHHRMRLVETL